MPAQARFLAAFNCGADPAQRPVPVLQPAITACPIWQRTRHEPRPRRHKRRDPASPEGAPPAVPQGFAVFGADATLRKLVPAPPGAHWTEFARGRHFPAMEAPAWQPTYRRSSVSSESRGTSGTGR
jgi:hypothetical protein